MKIVDILKRENPWWQQGQILQDFKDKRKRAYCYKVILEAFRWFQSHKVLLMEGPRQVGKTLILQHIVDELLKTGILPQAICYIDLQIPDIGAYVRENSLNSLINCYFDSILPSQLPNSPLPFFPLLLLDEVQHAEEWESWLKKFSDDPRFKAKIIATGSALRLSQGKRESGVGRWNNAIYIPHFTFYEYVQTILETTRENASFIGVEPTWDWISPRKKEFEALKNGIPFSSMREAFDDYLAKGGYPQPASQEKAIAQKNIRLSITDNLLKDPVNLKMIRGPLEFEKLFFYLADHTGGIFSKDKICKESGLNRVTLAEYLRCLEDIHLIWKLPLYKSSGTKALKAFEKIHVGTPCIASSLKPMDADGSLRGPLLECAVASSLYTLSQELHGSVYYWREGSDGKEVDTIFEWSEGLIPIEVKSGDNKSGLRQFKDKFSKLLTVSYLLKDEDQWDYREGEDSPDIVMPISYFLYYMNSTELRKYEQEWRKMDLSTNSPLIEIELPNSLKDSQIFRTSKKFQFVSLTNGKPFYRIIAGPQNNPKTSWSNTFSKAEFDILLQNPPQIRQGMDGTWYPGVGNRVVPKSFNEGIRAEDFYDEEKKDRYKSIFLYFNGALEFFVPIDDSFLLHEVKQKNWINPFPLIEYTVNFFRLFKKMNQILNLQGPYWFELQLEGVQGLELHPGHPLSLAYRDPIFNSDRVIEENIELTGNIPFLNPYKEDIEAYEILKNLYFKLGLREDTLPFFDKDGICRIK